MLVVANRKNLKQYSKQLLGNNYTEEKEKELINLCTKKTVNDYHDGYSHKSFAIRDWLTEIDNVIGSFGVGSLYPDVDCQYCNTGDTYAITILYFEEKLRIGDWGTLYEEECLNKEEN